MAEDDKFIWNDEYLIGVDAMDNQHKILVTKINNLVDSLNADNFSLSKNHYDDLVVYVVKHFSEEEVFMDSIGYLGLSTHKIIHKKLLTTVGEFNDSITDGSVNKKEFFNFLKFWLKSHIMGIDVKYAEIAKAVA